MSPSVENAALVALLREGRRPWQVYAELVEETGSALHVLAHEFERDDASESLFALEAAGQAPSPAKDMEAMLDAASAELAGWRSDGIEVVTVLDPSYPENLRGVHDRPPLLFLMGRVLSADARAVAVVGSRAASAESIHTAGRFTGDFVDAGYTVVSGLAAGIDTAVHTVALASGGRTLAVVGTGLRRCYPPQNAQLARRIGQTGALVSQFWPDAPPTRRTFPMRNAVMSGMTLGTVIIQASHTSGTRIQARLALAQGRPVFLHRSLLAQPWARELAARPGTHTVASADDVIATIERLTADEELVADGVTAASPRR